MRVGLIIILVVAIVVVAAVIFRIFVNYYTGKVLLEKYLSEKKMRSGNRPAKLTPIERRLPVVEAFLMRYGASPIHTKNQVKMNLRTTFKLNDAYYRVSTEQIEGKDYIILNVVENPKFADVGVMDSVAIFEVDAPDEKIEEEIKRVLNIADE